MKLGGCRMWISGSISAAPAEALSATEPSGALCCDKAIASAPRKCAVRMMDPTLPGSSYQTLVHGRCKVVTIVGVRRHPAI